MNIAVKYLLSTMLVLGAGIATKPSWAQTPGINPELRVLLSSIQNNKVAISAAGGLTVKGENNNLSFAPKATASVEVFQDGIKVETKGRLYYSKKWTISSSSPLKVVAGKVSRIYRGALVAGLVDGKVMLINRVLLEDYLMGVLPSEMWANFPLEALKAQSIAARSWTACNRWKHNLQGADLCDTTDCQAYLGVSNEDPRTSAAVKSTTGTIITIDGRVLDAMYGSDCGGEPANRPDVFDVDANGVHYCAGNPKHNWKQMFTWNQLTVGSPASTGNPQDGVSTSMAGRDMKVTYEGPNRKRISEVLFTSPMGQWKVSGKRLRDKMKLPSSVFSMTMLDSDTIALEGVGSGHGQGMCQRGAEGRAKAGMSYTQILAFYYPGGVMSPLTAEIWNNKPMRLRDLPDTIDQLK